MSANVPAVWLDQFHVLREIPGLGTCGVQKFMVTSGLLVKLTFDGDTVFDSYYYERRYCYAVTRDAVTALQEWDGTGDPPGEWIKEKQSGRLGPGAPR